MYERTVQVPQTGWKLSSLFHELQESAGEASALWHASGEDLARHGLMWVVVRYEAGFARPILPGESLTVKTWAQPFRHMMSQRNYILSDQKGKTVLTAAGIWTIVDRNTRKMVEPSVFPVSFPHETEEYSVNRPKAPEKTALIHHGTYVVQPVDLDTNMHMNNTRYFDLVDNLIGNEAPEQQIQTVRAAYLNEAKLGDRIDLNWGGENSLFYFFGKIEDSSCFEISLRYQSV